MSIIDNQVGNQDDYGCCYDGGDDTGQGTIVVMVKMIMMTMIPR